MGASGTSDADKPLLIERPVRSWEFLCAAGKRAGIFGNDRQGRGLGLSAEVMRDFHVTMHHDGKALPRNRW